MERRRPTVLRARRAGLALLVAAPLVLSQPAGGQTPKPDVLPESDLIDPDCHPRRAQEVDPSRLEEPDGVCPPGAPEPPAPTPPPPPDSGSGSPQQPGKPEPKPEPSGPKEPATSRPGKQHAGSG